MTQFDPFFTLIRPKITLATIKFTPFVPPKFVKKAVCGTLAVRSNYTYFFDFQVLAKMYRMYRPKRDTHSRVCACVYACARVCVCVRDSLSISFKVHYIN